MVIRNSEFYDKIHDFKNTLSSTKIKHENWDNQKKDDVISILNSKLNDMEEILKNQKFEFEIKGNANIKLKMEFEYLKVELKYNKIFNGNIEVTLLYPEIKNEQDKVKKESIGLYKDPNEINEVEINKNLHTALQYIKYKF
jgi:CRISPR/Cas system CSM-associated protein Csm3 (group 7 of RAMP superfamily)